MQTFLAAAPVSPPLLLLGLPVPPLAWTVGILGAVLALLATGALLSRRPAFRAKLTGGRQQANTWILTSIDAWEKDGRIQPAEAVLLRSELTRPDFAAVLPHFGVHLTIGVFLRFPIGSITRASYTLMNILAANTRFLTHRMDRRELRQARQIHTPVVLLISGMPGIGTFAYLASKPFRSNHLLLRVFVDAILIKVPKGLYERSGLRALVARPTAADAARTSGLPGVLIRTSPARMATIALAITAGFVALHLAMDTIQRAFEPDFLGWQQLQRITGYQNEASLATWFQVIMLFICAVLLAVITVVAHARGARYVYHWGFLALIVLGFSIDEQAKFHDAGGNLGPRLREMVGYEEGALYYGWALLAITAAVILGLAYWRFLRDLAGTSRLLFVIAGGLYVAGEAGVELINGWLISTRGQSYTYDTFTLLEEVLGTVGVVVAFAALLWHIQTEVGTIHVSLEQTGAPQTAAGDVDPPDSNRLRLVVVPLTTHQREDRPVEMC